MAEPTPEAKSRDKAAAPEAPAAPAATTAGAAEASHSSKDGEHAHAAPAKGAAAIAKVTAAATAAKAGLKNLLNRLGGLNSSLGGSLRAVVDLPKLLYKGDALTRILLAGFIVSILVLVFTARLLYERFGPKYAITHRVEISPEENRIESQKKLQILAENVVFLQHFEGTLAEKASPENEESTHPYEMELYVEADSPETSRVIKAHLNEVREMVVFASRGLILERVETDEGKEDWRKRIAVAIDKGIKHWAPQSKIMRVYFTRLLLDASLR